MSFWIFGKQKTPKEILRENQRALRSAMRDLERERTNLQRQEKTLIIEIKQMAKKGQMSAAKIMAKDLVRTRSQITKFYQLKSHLQAVSLRMQTLQSQQAMGEAMKGATKAMITMNKRMNIPAMQKILQNFEMQSEMMDMKEEMMADAMDDIFDEDQEEEETDEILNQVLDEIGINLSSELVDAPTGMAATGVRQKTPAALAEGGSGGGGRRPEAATVAVAEAEVLPAMASVVAMVMAGVGCRPVMRTMIWPPVSRPSSGTDPRRTLIVILLSFSFLV